MKTITRRRFVSLLTSAIGATATGALITAPSLVSAMNFRPTTTRDLTKGKVFNHRQFVALKTIVDTILPKTDTPSASELDCHGFCDHQLLHCYNSTTRQNIVTLIDKIDALALQEYSQTFAKVSANNQLAILTLIDSGALANGKLHQYFMQLKHLTVFGYFTSEVGATQALNYQAIPNGYKGSIPYDENSKAWGSLAYY